MVTAVVAGRNGEWTCGDIISCSPLLRTRSSYPSFFVMTTTTTYKGMDPSGRSSSRFARVGCPLRLFSGKEPAGVGGGNASRTSPLPCLLSTPPSRARLAGGMMGWGLSAPLGGRCGIRRRARALPWISAVPGHVSPAHPG